MRQLFGDRCIRRRLNISTRRTYACIFISLMGAAGWTPVAIAAGQDSYTTAIEAEGNRLEFLGQAKKEHEMLMRQVSPTSAGAPKRNAPSPPAAANAPPPVTAAPAAVPAPVTKTQFEHTLRERLPSSYALYELLETAERDAVFREYANAKTEGTIRFLPAVNRIIALSSKGKMR